ncbi:MAG: arylsulfotransferase family protein, partial [Acidimicrobiales bacterium]
HVALAESYASPSAIPANGGEYDFFHANSIDVDTDNNLLISSRNTWAVYKIERRTGSVIWRLNGKRSDFTMGSGSRFEFQHDAKHFGNGQLTVFDDGGSPNVALSSRGLLLSVDETTHRVELVQEYLPDPSFVTGSQGSVQMLPNGNAFVGWGAEPYATEYASDGRLLFELQLAPTGVSYRAFRFEWTGRPDDSPAIALQAASGNKTNVFVSWNGATEVRSWRMLAGRNARSLTTIRTVPRVGFETMITVPSHPAIAVSALDASGTELGRTRTVSG